MAEEAQRGLATTGLAAGVGIPLVMSGAVPTGGNQPATRAGEISPTMTLAELKAFNLDPNDAEAMRALEAYLPSATAVAQAAEAAAAPKRPEDASVALVPDDKAAVAAATVDSVTGAPSAVAGTTHGIVAAGAVSATDGTTKVDAAAAGAAPADVPVVVSKDPAPILKNLGLQQTAGGRHP